MFPVNEGTVPRSLDRDIDDFKPNGDYFENHILRARLTSRTLGDVDGIAMRIPTVSEDVPVHDDKTDFMLHLMKDITQAADFSNTHKAPPPRFDEERFERNTYENLKGGEGISDSHRNQSTMKFMQDLMDQGFLQATKFDVSQDVRPSWFDEEKFERGQQVFKDNYFAFVMSKILGTILGFSIVKTIGPIILNGNADTPLRALKRYVQTLLKMESWYYSDPFQKGTTAYKNMAIATVLHRNIFNKMSAIPDNDIDILTTVAGKDSKPVCAKSRPLLLEDLGSSCPFPIVSRQMFVKRVVWMNQLDMAYASFTFSILPTMFPERFGLSHITDNELSDYLYSWRCFSYLLGIDDKFNIFAGSLEQVRQRGHFFIENALKPALCEPEEDFEHMSRAFADGVSYVLPGMSFEIVLKYLCRTLNLKVPSFERTMTFTQGLCHNILWFAFAVVCRVSIGRKMLNKLAFYSVRRLDKFLCKRR